MEVTLTSKGQITLPKEIRDVFDLKQGDKIIVENSSEDGFFLRPKTKNVMCLAGRVQYDGPPVSIEEMNQAVADALAEKHGLK